MDIHTSSRFVDTSPCLTRMESAWNQWHRWGCANAKRLEDADSRYLFSFGCSDAWMYTRRIMGVLLDIRLGTYVPWICQKSIENETNHKSHSVNGSNYIQSFSHPYLNPKFIWINNRIVGEAEGGPSTNHSHLPRASGQLPNISSPSFHLPFSSSLWLLSHLSFFFPLAFCILRVNSTFG